MRYLNIIIILILSASFAYSLWGSRKWLEEIDHKEHKLYIFYPFARLLLRRLHLDRLLNRNRKTSEAVKALYINNKPEMQQSLYLYGKVSLVLFVMFLFHLLSLLGQLSPSREGKEIWSGGYINRPEQGEGSREVDLRVSASRDDSPEDFTEDISLRISEREYTEEELKERMDQAVTYLEARVLRGNNDFFHIQEDLNFIEDIPGTGISVEWRPENYDLITDKGRVNNDNLKPEGIQTRVTARLIYRKTQRQHVFTFTIVPKALSGKEVLVKRLYEELEKQAHNSRQDSQWRLPEELDGYALKWEETEEGSGVAIILLGLFTAATLWIYSDKELEKRLKKRRNQMLMDYPEIINKFNLLVYAGMTIKQAWCRIAEDYSGNNSARKLNKRYAYEEMLLTAHELKLGMPEGNAYEQFGRRTGILAYMKFGSLIAQNLKKGSKGLAELLSREAMEAFEDRKELAKRLGEEAGTKLLGPMMIMLLIVLIIIVIPAFMSFTI